MENTNRRFIAFEDLRNEVIEKMCQGERSPEYLEIVNDTLQVIKDYMINFCF